jgi:hypothetical protein
MSYMLQDKDSAPIQTGEEETKELKMPITAIRWRPLTERTRTKNVLISIHADGSVRHWHVTSGKCLNRLHDEFN